MLFDCTVTQLCVCVTGHKLVTYFKKKMHPFVNCSSIIALFSLFIQKIKNKKLSLATRSQN
jgi:hypothetical protein